MSSGPKWFLCFRPPSATVDIDLVTDTGAVDCSADKVLTYLAAAAKHKRKEMNLKNKKAATKETENSTLEDGGCGSQSPPTRGRRRRSFSGFVKEAFYRNALVRRAREKKSILRRRSSSGSFSESQSDRSDDSVVGDWKDGIRIYRIPAVEEEGGRETSEEEEEVRKEKKEKAVRRKRRSSGGGGGRKEWVFLALMMLLVTVFFGRLLAVLATTAWMYVWESRRRAAAAWKIVEEINDARRRKLVRDSKVGNEEEDEDRRIVKNVMFEPVKQY